MIMGSSLGMLTFNAFWVTPDFSIYDSAEVSEKWTQLLARN